MTYKGFFEQQKNHLRSVTCDRRPQHPTPPSAEKVTLSSVIFFEPFPKWEPKYANTTFWLHESKLMLVMYEVFLV